MIRTSEERSPSTKQEKVCWVGFEYWMERIFEATKDLNIKYIYGMPRGGLLPAVWLSHRLNAELVTTCPLECPFPNMLIVEDVIDTGFTIEKFAPLGNLIKIVSLVRKPWAPKIFFSAHETESWIQFPWENK